ncbi:hypothetical protein SKAU_G00181690 [Synaphobranchus kaupii]|uniref:Uncharacterized protein n=1 Tax=Synaphobranchus kaupii TaxID=118154 RepID=A0A9Q1FN28_SYNKA|nr:hypothetical protein SKAU_G00181690 [Synaphobranchus kaupii]
MNQRSSSSSSSGVIPIQSSLRCLPKALHQLREGNRIYHPQNPTPENQVVSVLVDSGADGNFIDADLVSQLHLPRPLQTPLEALTINGAPLSRITYANPRKREAVDLSSLPPEYLDLREVFSKSRATSLPPHRPYDCAIDLLPYSIQMDRQKVQAVVEWPRHARLDE